MKKGLKKKLIEFIVERQDIPYKPRHNETYTLTRDIQNKSFITCASENKVLIQLTDNRMDENIDFTIFDFCQNDKSDIFLFSYNGIKAVGRIIKSLATDKSNIVSELLPAELDCTANNGYPYAEICYDYAYTALSMLGLILEREKAGFSLADFGYLNLKI